MNGTTGVVIGREFVRWENVPDDYDLMPTLERVPPNQIRLMAYPDGREKSYTLECCGERHRIWCYSDGSYVLEDHSLETQEDRDIWKAMESLGNDAPMCFRVWKTSPKQVQLREQWKRFL